MAYRAVYKMETLTTDYSGNGYTLTNLNTVTQCPGRRGKGADLGNSNTNKSLYINNNLGVQTGDQTVGCWVNFNAFTASMILQKSWDGNHPGTNNQWTMKFPELYSTTTLRISMYGDPVIGGGIITHGFTVGTWHFLSCTFSGSSYEGKMYFDGKLVDTTTYNAGLSANCGNLFALGAQGDRTTGYPTINWASMKFDEVFVENTLFSNQKLKTMYAAQSGRLQC